jgi:protein-tyrosine phosphatase
MLDTKINAVVFICTANYYRSRFAEYLFNALAEKKGISWRAASRGLQIWMADGQGPISRHTVDRLTAMGVPLDAQRAPAALAETDLEEADLVIALKEAEHRAMMEDQFPDWSNLIEYWHVDDIDCATPDEALPVCQTSVEALVDRLAVAERGAKKRSHAAA